jgi:hypothetical protein
MSENGLRLKLDSPLGAGEMVTVELRDYVLAGTVIYCEPYKTGCAAGIELTHSISRHELETFAYEW